MGNFVVDFLFRSNNEMKVFRLNGVVKTNKIKKQTKQQTKFKHCKDRARS